MQVYLSPHHDDVCFSIGNRASRLGGDLVNLFTISRYVGAPLALPPDEEARIEVVSRLRRQEDEAFAEAAGLTRHALGLREARLTGYGPFDCNNIAAEVDMLSAQLMPLLAAMLPRDGDPDAVGLYCPMGIGAHRNHLSTLLAVRGAYEALRRRCTVFLYEDLHYASAPEAREAGLQRAARVFGPYRLSPLVEPLGAGEVERKMQWIGLYSSQHPRPPRMSEFTPASGIHDGPHEIIWRVSLADEAQA